MKKFLLIFLVFANCALAGSNHIPVDRIGFRTGERVQVKHEWWFWGFRQEEWLDCVIVGDRICYTCEHHYLYWPLDEKDLSPHMIRKSLQPVKNQ